MAETGLMPDAIGTTHPQIGPKDDGARIADLELKVAALLRRVQTLESDLRNLPTQMAKSQRSQPRWQDDSGPSRNPQQASPRR